MPKNIARLERYTEKIRQESDFPIFSPTIDKIEITKKSRARRSKLYYIRTKAVKDVRRKMRSVTMQEETIDKDEEIETKE